MNDRARPDKCALIRLWWNRARGVAPDRLAGPLHLRDAFLAVLGLIPESDLKIFLAYDPAVVCLEGCIAQVSSRTVPRDCRQDRYGPYVSTIHFTIELTRQTPAALLCLVAHEVAHIVLGHLDDFQKPQSQRETEVADKVAHWGISEPEKFFTHDSETQLRLLADRLEQTIFDLGIPDEDDPWSCIEPWAIPRLNRVLEGLREFLRPGQLSRLCAPSVPPVLEPNDRPLAPGDRPGGECGAWPLNPWTATP